MVVIEELSEMPKYLNVNGKMVRSVRELLEDVSIQDVIRGSGTIEKNNQFRLDMQGVNSNGDYNLQVQKNGSMKTSTVSTVFVSPSVEQSTDSVDHIDRLLREAFIQCLNDKHIRRLVDQ